jgi:hypothetical protein
MTVAATGLIPAKDACVVSLMSICPFCGVVTEDPHENQQSCLDALAAEIARLRTVLQHVQSAVVPTPQLDDDAVPDRPDGEDAEAGAPKPRSGGGG